MTEPHWTPREIEIVRLTADGLTAQQIARRLVLAPKTVENHIWRAKQKAGCPNRAALVRYAVTHGIAGEVPEPAPPVSLDPDGDRADEELTRLISRLDGAVLEHLDADDVVEVVDEPVEPGEAREGIEPPHRSRRGVAVAVLMLTLTGAVVTGVTVYSFARPDPPAAAETGVGVSTSPVSSSTLPSTASSSVRSSSTAPTTTKRKIRAVTPTADPTIEELRTAVKRAARDATCGVRAG